MQERQYQKLIVWQEGHKLCLFVYKITGKFPDHERFGLRSQIRRCSYSVPMNIAEGNSKRTKGSKLQFLEIAETSLEELHYQSFLALDLGYITKKEYEELDDRIQRIGYLLHKLRSSLV